MGTVTMFFSETFTAVHFKSDHFVSLHLTENFSFDYRADGFADSYLSVAGRKQDIGKLHLVAGVAVDLGYEQCLVFFDPKLAAGDLDYCEHRCNIRAAKVRVSPEFPKLFARKFGTFKGLSGHKGFYCRFAVQFAARKL